MEVNHLNNANNAPREEEGCSHSTAPWMQRSELGLVILRVGAAGMLLCHGWPKLLMLLQGHGAEWMDPLGIGSTLSLALCTFAEFFCSIAIILGLLTRLAALAIVINFWVAIFIYGGQSILPQAELPMLYLICFVTLLCTGPGPFSVDRFLLDRRKIDH